MTLDQKFTQAIEDTMHSGRGEKCTEIATDFAVEFAEWLDYNCYECFLMTDEGVKHWSKYDKGNYTTRELISLFMEEKKIKEK